MTSRSHDLRVPEPTITYLLGIVDFGQVKIKMIATKKTNLKQPKSAKQEFLTKNTDKQRREESKHEYLKRIVTIIKKNIHFK